MTGGNVEISVSPFGNQLPPAGQEVVMLLSQVRGNHGLSFWVHRDVSGQFVQIEADPAVTRTLTGCKPHDCGDNNALVLYAPETGAVYGQLMVRQVPRRIGVPPPDVAAALDRLWRAEWRQGR